MTENDAIKQANINKKRRNWLFLGLMGLVELVILIPTFYVIIKICSNPGNELYSLVALLLLLIWFGGLGAYYAWAIYFYNINRGLTNESWAILREEIKYSPESEAKIPKENPNTGETLGLPKGTIRGTLALTLMIGGLAMTIAAFGMDNVLKENTFLVDNFDFFKTAFLMMIAFYFGNKSLELIGYKSQKTISAGENQNETASQQQKLSQPPPVPPAEDASLAKQILKKGKAIFSSYKKNKTDAEDGDFDYPGAVQ